MASVAAKVANAGVLIPLFSAASGAVAAYGGYSVLAHRDACLAWATWFVSGPGRGSRLLLAAFLALNAKSLPLAWTFRVFGAITRHVLVPGKPLTPDDLFKYSVTTTRTTLLETDYNFHKSNSTYFADLDPARSHLVMRLLGPGIAQASSNAKTKLVLQEDGKPYPGVFSIGLGAVACSFRREIAPLQAVELWTRVLAWDRKWLYMVTHFVVKGKVTRDTPEKDLQKYVVATAISKYVFKLDRFTVHPAFLMEASGVLPARPGGWRGGAEGVGSSELGAVTADGENAWQHVEAKRVAGMEIASHFAALDQAGGVFDGARNGHLGRFFPG